MDQVRLQCLGALYGDKKLPSSEEVNFQLEQEKVERSNGESERIHQMRLHRHLLHIGLPHFAPFNEGHQGEKEARGAKMMGMSPGICDIVVPMARKPYHGLFIELKSSPHGRVSGAQEWWLKTLLNASYAAYVSWSFEESVKIVEEYMILPVWN